MTSLLRRMAAFFLRDLRVELSYRLALVLQLGGLAWMLVLVYFGGRLVGAQPALAPYGGDWFRFVVLGYAPLEYLRVALFGFSGRLREAQTLGTLEAMLTTRAGIPTIVFGSVAYPFALATVRAALFFAAGLLSAPASLPTPDAIVVVTYAGLSLLTVEWTVVLTFMALSLLTFGALGLLSASFVMVFKKGDPVSWIFFGTSTLLSGLFFPTSVLGRAEPVSRLFPLTYAMEGSRLGAQGVPLAELRTEALVLLGFSVVLVPLSTWCFRAALDRARRDGTLSHY
jgi:ABC-2 type transport system permease protein